MAKHHKHHKQIGAAMPLEELESRAYEALAGERWRQARDFFKVLCKKDHEKYLPGLIQANRGLAEALMQKGQIAEAEQVLAHLRTIAPQEEFAAVELKGALRGEDWAGAAQTALQLWTTRGDALSEQDKQVVADSLVLAFPQMEEGGEAADWPEPLRQELTAVLGALRAVSEERYEAAQESLRPLARGSVFANWKTLIKGLIAFHSGAREKALSLFSMLPPTGAPSRAAAAIRALLEPQSLAVPRSAERDQAVVGVCRFLGAPGIGELLVQADELWKAKKAWESFSLMRRAPEFPSLEPTFAGLLSVFYFRAAFSLDEEARNRYLTPILRLRDNESLKNREETFLMERMIAQESLLSGFDPAGAWADFLKHFASDPRRAKLTSLAWFAVADRLLRDEAEDEPFGFGSRSEKKKRATATRLLKESIENDPENLAASLRLLEIYKSDKKSAEQNRLLDEMTRRFPNQKDVLIQAGIGCIERKTYVKGLAYLEKARELDPLDPQVALLTVNGQIRMARQQYEKKQLEKARETFQLIKAQPAGAELDLDRGDEFLKARQGILEMLYGDNALGEELIAQLRKEARSPSAMLLFLHGCYRVYSKNGGRGKETPFFVEFSKRTPQGARERLDMLKVFFYVMAMGEDMSWPREADLVLKHLMPAARKEFTMREAGELGLALWNRAEARKFVKLLTKEGLRQDPGNPRFRILDILIEVEPPFHRVEELEDAVEDAKKEGDLEAVKAAEGPLRTLQDLGGGPLIGDPFDDWDEEDEGAEIGGFGTLPPIPAGIPAEIAEMKAAADKMTDAEFAAFRKKSAKFIPLPIFDLFMGTRPKGKSSPKSRNDQPELF